MNKQFNSYNLFLDDERKPSDVKWIALPSVKWDIVRNYKDFVNIIEKLGLPSIVSFDHDLADEHYSYVIGNVDSPKQDFKEKTGMDCVKWLVNYCMVNDLDFPEYYIHSMNPIGKDNIESYIKQYIKHRNA